MDTDTESKLARLTATVTKLENLVQRLERRVDELAAEQKGQSRTLDKATRDIVDLKAALSRALLR